MVLTKMVTPPLSSEMSLCYKGDVDVDVPEKFRQLEIVRLNTRFAVENLQLVLQHRIRSAHLAGRILNFFVAFLFLFTFGEDVQVEKRNFIEICAIVFRSNSSFSADATRFCFIGFGRYK